MRINLTRYFLLLIAALFIAAPAMEAKKKLHTIGDSTMANYATDGSTDKRGWCQMLQQFFNSDNVTVNNRGKSGASSKSFYKEAAYWPTLVTGGSDQMKAGDYLLIQFAHNDEKTSGTDGDELIAYYKSKGMTSEAAAVDYRGTTAFDTYRTYIRAYINEAKKMGVTPIVVGPICRKYFTSGDKDISRSGRHDLGDKFNVISNGNLLTGQKVAESDDTYDYVMAAKAVAAEFDDVPFIDLTTLTANLYIKYGSVYCTNNLFCKDDSTHPCGLGATLIAREFASQLKAQADAETDTKKKAVLMALAQDVIVSSEITFNPTSGDLGKAYQGQQVVKEFNVSAFGIASDSKMTITTDGSFLVSADKKNFSQSIEINADGANIITTIYVKADLKSAGKQSGKLTATTGSLTSTLDLTAECVSLVGGTEASAVWKLTASPSPEASELLTVADETVTSNLVINNYATVGSATMQRIKPADGTWPAGEIDEVSSRYVEFKATCPADYKYAINKISFNVAGSGGGGICYHAYYSTNADFSNAVLIGEGLSIGNGNVQTIEKELAEEISEGQSVYVRVYPWYNTASAATGKYICLSDVTISGVASKAGAQSFTFENAAIAWPLGNNAPDVVNYSDEAMSPFIQLAGFQQGADMTMAAAQAWSGTDGITPAMLRFGNGSAAAWSNSSYEAGKSINFTVTPQTGFTFIPSKVSFKACRFGTNGGTIDVLLSAGDNSTTVATAQAPTRSADSKTLTTFSYEVSGVAATEDAPLSLSLGINGLGAGKYLGLCDVIVEGTLAGTMSDVTKYSLNLNVSPADAGTVTCNPELASYKEGTSVAISAQPGFGYAFSEWQENGATLSADATTTVQMNQDRTITAAFTPVNVYTVTTKATNDQEMPLGSVTLSPDEHNGQYEEGTEITATATESKILKFAGWTDNYMNSNVTSATRQITVSENMELVANYEVQDFVAVFDASSVESYAYTTTSGYPFSADLSWDDSRNAHACIVKASDGSLLYTQDGGTPVVRNRKGCVLSTINGLYQNGFRTSDIAWQYSFSTKNFTSATFVGEMAAKNMANKSYKAMYSVDGVNYTDIEGAAWDMTANVAKELNFSLPASAMDQELVYVRIIGTGTEQLSSNYSVKGQFMGLDYYSNSEAGVGNVFILGEAKAQDDGKNPTVASSSPANGANNVSASGTVSISYSERIQKSASNAVVTITGNGETKNVEPAFSSRSISFPYANLVYGADYTVTIPAGYVEDKLGNAADEYTFTFTVMNRVKPASRMFDAVVDGSLAQLSIEKGEFIEATADMPRQYRSIQNAIDAAPADGNKPYLIYVKNGYYRDPNFSFNSSYGNYYTDMNSNTGTETKNDLSGGINQYDSCRIVYINKPNIHIIGQSRDNVIIATDRLDGSVASDHSKVWYHINAGATIEVMAKGTDFHMENLTVDNENWTKKHMEGPQALCFNISADRAVLNNVRTRSYQDTYYNGGTYNRTFWNNSEIHGAVDFIYGASDVWFENCVLNINRKSGGYIVAPNHPEGTRWGYVFNNTRITTDEVSDPSTYSIWLGRPWHEKPKTVFLHTTMELTPCDSLWHSTMGGLPALWAVYDFHNAQGYAFTGAQNASRKYYYYTSNGVKYEGMAKASITDEEAAAYTMANVFAGDGTTTPTGYWNPQPIVEKTAKPVLTVNGNVATWTTDEYAICYVVQVNGKQVAFAKDGRFVGNEGDVITVQSVNEYGALSELSDAATLGAATDVIGVEASDAKVSNNVGIYTIDGKKVSSKIRRGVYIENNAKVMY